MWVFIDRFLGYDKWWISWNFFGLCFGIRLRGEICKLGNGMEVNGFVIFFNFNFLFIVCYKINLFFFNDDKFLEKWKWWVFWKGIVKLNLNFLIKNFESVGL